MSDSPMDYNAVRALIEDLNETLTQKLEAYAKSQKQRAAIKYRIELQDFLGGYTYSGDIHVRAPGHPDISASNL